MSEGETTIRPLSETTVQRIAAGEVVERPASVVKELVENSLDADASRVEVQVEAGGTERIAVRDDGVGMSEPGVRVAVEEHTTSKIRSIDDLESGVATLGFRGEALYTVGAVSRLTVRTKPRGGDRGTELRLVGGEVESVGPAGCPEGTTVEVADLFFNTPARERYLKADATEFSHVNRVVTRYALANPDVAFSLTHDDREVFSTTGQGDLQSTVLSVYGREVAEAMVPVERDEGEGGGAPNDDESSDDSAAVSVSGYVSHPETTRSTREYVSTYVNGRYVRSATVRDSVLDAYGNQLAPDRYPFAVLALSVPGDAVDVNVHPRKMEVRFGDEGRVSAAVRDAVESALLDHGLVRSSAPRGRSAPDEAAVEPEREQSELDEGSESLPAGANADDESATPSEESDSRDASEEAVTTARETTADHEPHRDDDPNRNRGPNHDRGPHRDRDVERDGDSGRDDESHSDRRSHGDRDSQPREERRPRRDRQPNRDRDSRPHRGDSDFDREPGRKFRGATESGTLGDADGGPQEFDRLPQLRVLGQLHDTYVVAETESGLVLVDQHAADERVNYERLCERFAGETTTQVLASPVELELTAREAALFEEYREALARLGFHSGVVGERLVEVTTVPTVLDETLDPELLRDALGEFVASEKSGEERRDGTERDGTSVAATADALISDLACYPSVTGNTSLREGDVVDLLAALDNCENPYACPHGRPTIIELGEDELADRFERDYPGHAGRRSE